MFFFTSSSPPDIRVHIVGSQLKTLENTFKTCGTATTTFCMGVEQSIGKAILHYGWSQRWKKSNHLHKRLFWDPQIYTKSAWFTTNSMLLKVRDSRQIQYQKGVKHKLAV